jgi:hypothetical protein
MGVKKLLRLVDDTSLKLLAKTIFKKTDLLYWKMCTHLLTS